MTGRTSREAIRRAIHEAGMTQESVAAALGITPVTVSRWVTGVHDPGFDELDALAVAVGQPLVLVFGTEKAPPEPAWVERLLTGVIAIETKEQITSEELALAQAEAAIYLAADNGKPPRPTGGGGGAASNA